MSSLKSIGEFGDYSEEEQYNILTLLHGFKKTGRLAEVEYYTAFAFAPKNVFYQIIKKWSHDDIRSIRLIKQWERNIRTGDLRTDIKEARKSFKKFVTDNIKHESNITFSQWEVIKEMLTSNLRLSYEAIEAPAPRAFGSLAPPVEAPPAEEGAEEGAESEGEESESESESESEGEEEKEEEEGEEEKEEEAPKPEKKAYKCGKCKQTGHNAKGCKA
jgi:hypothetical protein